MFCFVVLVGIFPWFDFIWNRQCQCIFNQFEMMRSLYRRPNKRAYVIQQNFLNAHIHCLNSEAKRVLPSSPAKGSKLHIQNPAEDLQEFNRNNDSLSIKWLPGTKALYTSYSHCLNNAFRKKKM